jgi:thiamine biosynthesis lipoprotein
VSRGPARSSLLPALAVAVAVAGGAARARPLAAAPRVAVVFSGPTMGTRYTVRVSMVPGDEAANERIRAAIDRELSLANRLFSAWDPASEISRLNAHPSSEPFPVSAETVAALELGRRASELTGGAFDVTVAPLVEAWGFGPAKRPPTVPAADTLAALRARVGYRLLQLDATRRTVTKARPDLACDVSALAGGWAADRLAAAILALGHPDVLVDIGGEVAARGRRPDGSRWRVAVETPEPGRVSAVVELENAAVATSGDYRNVWTDAQGRRRSHIIDPRTGEPISHGLASVTVVHRDGAWADALATGLLVLGPDAGRALAARERLAARLVLRQPDGTYAEWSTPGFDAVAAPAR